jgi:hypothetical protein
LFPGTWNTAFFGFELAAEILRRGNAGFTCGGWLLSQRDLWRRANASLGDARVCVGPEHHPTHPFPTGHLIIFC